MIVLHVALIIHGFLFEAHHLEKTLTMDLFTDHSNVFEGLEFVFYFFSVEFHLACVERITLSDK